MKTGAAGWRIRCFERGSRKAPVIDEDQVRDLHAKIGEPAVANSFWKESSNPGAGSEARYDRTRPSGPVHRPAVRTAIDPAVVVLLFAAGRDGIEPCADAVDRRAVPRHAVRQMTWHLRNDGHAVNGKRIRRLMRLMGLMPIYQKPNTSKPTKGHKTYPYLLRGLRVDGPNQVWCMDITYLPMRRGFLFLVAIMDWHTRMVLSWRISNTLDADFCPSRQIASQSPAGQRCEALNEAIYQFGPPDIMNSDQGSQFTSFAWTDRLRRSGIRISWTARVAT